MSQSPTTLETFDKREYHPYGILQCLLITLEGKTVEVEVEFVDANLTYNLLLCRSWTYAMRAVASSLFRVILFPHQGKIVIVDQLSFFTSSSEGNVPFVEHTSIPLESVGDGLFKDPALMGVFSLPPPNLAFINMISVRFDHWFLPPIDQIKWWGDEMPLSLAELNYVEIVFVSSLPSESASLSGALDSYAHSPWLGDCASPNPLKEIFPSDEAIVETMSLEEPPWFNLHHRSSFLPTHREMLACLERLLVVSFHNPFRHPSKYIKCPLKGIWETSRKLNRSTSLLN